MEQVLGVTGLYLIVGFGYLIYGPFTRSRQMLLWSNVIGCLFFALYFHEMGAVSGMYAISIAALSSFLQSCFREEQLSSTFWLRNSIAFVLAGISIAVSFRAISDVLPVAAVVLSRFAEAQDTMKRILIFSIMPQLLWVGYAYAQELWIIMAGDTLLALSYLWGIYRHHKVGDAVVKPV